MLTFDFECVFSNWGTESDPEFKGYHNGNSEPRGFGMNHSNILLKTIFEHCHAKLGDSCCFQALLIHIKRDIEYN